MSENKRDERTLVQALNKVAVQYAKEGKFADATTVIAAAWTMLENSGGSESALGVSLRSTQGVIALASHQLDASVAHMAQAHDIAVRLYKDDHPHPAVILSNYGHLLFNAAVQNRDSIYAEMATEVLEEASQALDVATPQGGKYTQDFVRRVRQAARKRVQNAKQVLDQLKES